MKAPVADIETARPPLPPGVIGNRTARREVFKIELAVISKKVDFYGGLFSVKPHTHISAISKTNLIIIPSLNHNYEKAVKGNQSLIDWI